MPKSNRIYKAGKISFLLVCLFLCTACQREKAVFEAGTENIEIPAEFAEEDKTENIIGETGKTEKVNINTADMTELMTLPGIGEVRAAAIVEHRENYGDFVNIEDIMNVKGIKNGIFSKINNLICVK
jgi:competence protein ComEA